MIPGAASCQERDARGIKSYTKTRASGVGGGVEIPLGGNDTDKTASRGKAAAALMSLGAALFLLPIVALVLLRTAELLSLMPWGAGMAVLGALVSIGEIGGRS